MHSPIPKVNPTSASTPIEDQKICIWVDILGFSDKLEDEESYDELVKNLKIFRKKFGSYKTEIISDGILIELDVKSVHDLETAFQHISIIQDEFISETHYVLRGGIAVGKVHRPEIKADDDKSILISSGLSRAFKMESNDISWPIIATTEKGLEKLREIFKRGDDSSLDFGLIETKNQKDQKIFHINFLSNKNLKIWAAFIENLSVASITSVKLKYLWLLEYYHRKHGREVEIPIILGGHK